MENNDINQLADIVIDWAGVDIENLLKNWEASKDREETAPPTREFIKALVWTLSQEPEARALFGKLLVDETKYRQYR